MKFFSRPGPPSSKEFRRIVGLPKRDPDMTGKLICEALSNELRAEGGTQTLRPVQALFLAEAHDLKGAVGLMPVGSGKTLVSFLLPVVLKAQRPVLLVPAALVRKTQIEFAQLKSHWKSPDNYEIVSYEIISRRPGLLDELKPDLIVADECHMLKNKKAGVTKRVWRYWDKSEDPEVTFIPMSGTLTKRSFFDWWHLQCMALPDYMAVLPYKWQEAEHWADALDVKTKNRCNLGALKFFGPDIDSARDGFGQFLRTIPGVITSAQQDADASIYIERHKVSCPDIDEAMDRLSNRWELPDGTQVMRAADFWRHGKEIGNGFFYRWAEPGPFDWMEARRECNAFIRNKLKHSRKYETPAQIMEVYRDIKEIRNWLKVEPSFEPKTIPVGISDSVLKYSVALAKAHKALLWFEHKYVGKMLASIFRMAVFQNNATDIRTGQHIYDFRGGEAAVSIPSCSKGLNLQRWSNNVIISSPASGDTWEQLMGRTHRSGQEADTVTFHVIEAVETQINDFNQALADASYIQKVTGQSQKLMLADII